MSNLEFKKNPCRTGFVKAQINGVDVYSCFAASSATIAQYEEMLASLVLGTNDHIPQIINKKLTYPSDATGIIFFIDQTSIFQ